MRLPSSAHTSRPWRIHEITQDFRVEDVWALPTPGGPDDLHYLVRQFAETGEPGTASSSGVYRLLFAIRWKLGALLGWDKPEKGLGGRVRSLRERLPDDLRDAPRGPDSLGPFRSVYQLHDEWAAEIANGTVHGVLHLGWVPDSDGSDGDGGDNNRGDNNRGDDDGTGGYHGQLAVLVKPNGALGKVYMAGIKPFRYVGVYPALLQAMGRRWEETAGQRTAA